jgi:hypothetical protein
MLTPSIIIIDPKRDSIVHIINQYLTIDSNMRILLNEEGRRSLRGSSIMLPSLSNFGPPPNTPLGTIYGVPIQEGEINIIHWFGDLTELNKQNLKDALDP